MAEPFVTSPAERDYAEALCWYAERSIPAAEAFEAAVDSAFAAIAVNPERYPFCNERHRYYLLEKFPYQIIYRIVASEVLVMAVAHTSRDSSFWKNR